MEIQLSNLTITTILIIILVSALANNAVAVVDLAAQSIECSNEPADGIFHQGETIEVHWRIFNYGDERSDDFTIDFYVGDYYVGSDSDQGVRAQVGRHGYERCDLPSDIPYGDHALRMVIFCTNDNTPDNNESIGPDITVGEKGPPDLYFDYFGVGSGPYYAGDSVSIYGRIENSGHSTSDNYTLHFYIDGNKLGSEDHPGIEGHGSDSFDTTITLPDDFPAGVYYVDVELSCPGDSDSGNNSASGRITVLESTLPDISIQSVEATEGVYKPGDSIKVKIGIECGEGQLAGDVEVVFYASADTVIPVDDYRIQTVGFGSLEPGRSHTFEVTCRFPSDIPAGYYHIGAIITEPDTGSVGSDWRTVWVSEPMDPAVQTVRATAGTYSPGDEIKVYSLVKNVGERTSENYVLDYYLSTDTTITTDDYKIGYVDRSGLTPGQQHSYETTCRLPINVPAGNCYIGVIVTCPKDYDTTNNVGRDTATVEVVHPAGYVCGRATYEDKRRQQQAIRYALVEVRAEDNNNDPLDDPLLGETYTNQNGLYALILANDNNSSRDIYVKILAEGASAAFPDTTSKICKLKDEVLDETYALVSNLHPHPKASSVVIDLTSPRFEGGEFMVFDSIVEAFCKAKTYLNIEIEEVSVYWPSEAEASYFDPCEMEIYISQDDRGDRDVIMHEYGHYIAQIYGVAQGPVGEDGRHYWDQDLRDKPVRRSNEHAMNLAFREAWASLFSIATQYGDTWYPYSGDSSYDDEDENGNWTLKVDLDNVGDDKYSPGQYFENMNAGALWDIFDDKDTLSDPKLEKIWTISRDYKPESILDFWNNWFQKYEFEQEMKYIFESHKMQFERPR